MARRGVGETSCGDADRHPQHLRPRSRRDRALSVLVGFLALALVVAVVAVVSMHDSTRTPIGGGPAEATSSLSPAPTQTGRQPPGTPPAPAAGPALWQRTVSTPGPVLVPDLRLAAGAPLPTSAGLSSVLTPLLANPALRGDSLALVVADAATGQVLFDHGGSRAMAPASTVKLAVAAAALQVLGPDHRFTTKVVRDGDTDSVVLVGGGDPTLAGPAAGATAGYPTPARLSDLAIATALTLRRAGVTKVRLGYDPTLFTGGRQAPGWKPIYVTEGDVAPVSALEIDEGRTGLTIPPRAADPAATAAQAFARLLTAGGVAVTAGPSPMKAPAGSPTLASVQSATLGELVQRMLGSSDNDLAEALARHVAIAADQPATFAGGAKAVSAALVGIGVGSAGSRSFAAVDASGLSTFDRVQPLALVQVLERVLRPGHPALSPILAGLPVAGFSGTLSDRFRAGVTSAAAGHVRAKTGSLDGVVALAGYLDDASGRVLVFAVIANGVHPTAPNRARRRLPLRRLPLRRLPLRRLPPCRRAPRRPPLRRRAPRRPRRRRPPRRPLSHRRSPRGPQKPRSIGSSRASERAAAGSTGRPEWAQARDLAVDRAVGDGLWLHTSQVPSPASDARPETHTAPEEDDVRSPRTATRPETTLDASSRVPSADDASADKRLLGEILVDRRQLTPGQLSEALLQQRVSGKRLGALLVELGALDERDLADALGEHFGVPVVDLRREAPEEAAIARIPESTARSLSVVPLKLVDGVLEVAVADPDHDRRRPGARRACPSGSSWQPQPTSSVRSTSVTGRSRRSASTSMRSRRPAC